MRDPLTAQENGVEILSVDQIFVLPVHASGVVLPSSLPASEPQLARILSLVGGLLGSAPTATGLSTASFLHAAKDLHHPHSNPADASKRETWYHLAVQPGYLEATTSWRDQFGSPNCEVQHLIQLWLEEQQ